MQAEGIFASLSPHPLAFLFTDAVGRVVLADSTFSRITRRTTQILQPGTPLHEALGIEQAVADHLIKEVRQGGYARLHPLPVRTVTGTLRPTWGAGIATYDQHKTFIGLDIVLSYDPSPVGLDPSRMGHADVLTRHIQQTMAASAASRENSFLQLYLASQVDALLILLGRLGGPHICDALEGVINEVARTRGWQVSISQRRLSYGLTSIMFTAYGEILHAAADYAASVVGRRLVLNELRVLDSRLDKNLCNLITDVGLRVSTGDLNE